MTGDENKSLGDELTQQGGQHSKEIDSLGDHSTLGGKSSESHFERSQTPYFPNPDIEVVDLTARYKIRKSIGKGGMGEVLLAMDTRLDRNVAIKRIRGDAGTDQTAVARFLSEAKSVAALNHTNVVQIYDFGRDRKGPFLIMEYVAGGSLLGRCCDGPMELQEAVDFACQLCDGLTCAHSAGIIHRDVKPANILLGKGNIPKLSDFGLAKAQSRDQAMTISGTVLGTLDFMPPEQRYGTSLVDERSDLWSLAATLYQMVTGKSPKVIRIDLLPVELAKVLSKAVEEDKSDRFQTAIEFRDALRLSCDATQSATSQKVDSKVGVCPKCHSSNVSTRQFCNRCGESFKVACLACNAELTTWDNFCGECGSNQLSLLQQQQERQQELSVLDNEPIGNSIGMQLKLIPRGEFKIKDGSKVELVTLSNHFYMGVHAVTQRQYAAVMGVNPSQFLGEENPVERVSWEEAMAFCERLTESPAEKAAGRVYRLPTEAEWEYVCRAGASTSYCFGDDASELGNYAWFSKNSRGKTHRVADKQPNQWGLYDMHGNVWEWCHDWYGDNLIGNLTDPKGPGLGSRRVYRGGSWGRTAEDCRSTSRDGGFPSNRRVSIGFRIAVTPPLNETPALVLRP